MKIFKRSLKSRIQKATKKYVTKLAFTNLLHRKDPTKKYWIIGVVVLAITNAGTLTWAIIKK